MQYFSENKIDSFLQEDVPYLDLTTMLLGIGQQKGQIEFYVRESGILCGTEEVIRLFQKLDIQVSLFLPSGTRVQPDQVVLRGEGLAQALHMSWKVASNILEYASGVATRTRRLVDLAQEINPKITVLTTRKVFPGTKELSMKGVLAGGGWPHRLGLSETVLVFPQHLAFYDSFIAFLGQIPEIKAKACEKKVIVETESLEGAEKLAAAGVDGLQFDKVPAQKLTNWVDTLRQSYPSLLFLAAGGINEQNICAYAKTGVNAIVTTSVYFGRPLDIGTRMTKD